MDKAAYLDIEESPLDSVLEQIRQHAIVLDDENTLAPFDYDAVRSALRRPDNEALDITRWPNQNHENIHSEVVLDKPKTVLTETRSKSNEKASKIPSKPTTRLVVNPKEIKKAKADVKKPSKVLPVKVQPIQPPVATKVPTKAIKAPIPAKKRIPTKAVPVKTMPMPVQISNYVPNVQKPVPRWMPASVPTRQVPEASKPKSQRPSSPTKSDYDGDRSEQKRSRTPNFYNVRLSNAPVFLRRTSIRPPTLNFLEGTLARSTSPTRPTQEMERKSPVRQVNTPDHTQRPPSKLETRIEIVKREVYDEGVQTLPTTDTRGTQFEQMSSEVVQTISYRSNIVETIQTVESRQTSPEPRIPIITQIEAVTPPKVSHSFQTQTEPDKPESQEIMVEVIRPKSFQSHKKHLEHEEFVPFETSSLNSRMDERLSRWIQSEFIQRLSNPKKPETRQTVVESKPEHAEISTQAALEVVDHLDEEIQTVVESLPLPTIGLSTTDTQTEVDKADDASQTEVPTIPSIPVPVIPEKVLSVSTTTMIEQEPVMPITTEESIQASPEMTDASTQVEIVPEPETDNETLMLKGRLLVLEEIILQQQSITAQVQSVIDVTPDVIEMSDEPVVTEPIDSIEEIQVVQGSEEHLEYVKMVDDGAQTESLSSEHMVPQVQEILQDPIEIVQKMISPDLSAIEETKPVSDDSTSLTLSTFISDGEVLTHIYSEGEVVERLGRRETEVETKKLDKKLPSKHEMMMRSIHHSVAFLNSVMDSMDDVTSSVGSVGEIDGVVSDRSRSASTD